MIRLQVVNAADEAFLPAHFSQPRASSHILSRLRVDPDVVDTFITNRNRINPCQDIVPPRHLPAFNVGVCRAGRKRTAHVDAAMPALTTQESVCSHFATPSEFIEWPQTLYAVKLFGFPVHGVLDDLEAVTGAGKQ